MIRVHCHRMKNVLFVYECLLYGTMSRLWPEFEAVKQAASWLFVKFFVLDCLQCFDAVGLAA